MPESAAAPNSPKARGAYYSPRRVAAALVRWAVRRPDDRLLDPACGDGRFLAMHSPSAGVDCSDSAVRAARAAAPGSVVHAADFFEWAASARERFDCAAGNPPFIRYQRFRGAVRARARRLSAAQGAPLSGLASSWAPYLVVTASLLRPGGRMAFLVPAEIGHAPYAAPLLSWLASRFDSVRVVAVRHKIFPKLSEDVWVLYAEGFGGATDALTFAATETFEPPDAEPSGLRVSLEEWKSWNCRLRPLLLPARVTAEYRRLLAQSGTARLGDLASVGIGYVSGDNDFFHLSPSRAASLDIPEADLAPTVRRTRDLQDGAVTSGTVERWRVEDRPNFLLRLRARRPLAAGVRRYLESEEGQRARGRYKCRVREPWYSVPNVTAPDFFLAYLSSGQPALARNRTDCACANAIHAVHLRNGRSPAALLRQWDSPLTALSCEIEGHPLGGGALKLEPREARRVAVDNGRLGAETKTLLREGAEVLRRWRNGDRAVAPAESDDDSTGPRQPVAARYPLRPTASRVRPAVWLRRASPGHADRASRLAGGLAGAPRTGGGTLRTRKRW